MSENSLDKSGSGISSGFLSKVTKTRELSGHTLRQIDKTESTLHLISKPDREELLRNGELPEQSMATWEFLHSHAHQLFPEQVAQQIFGIWGKPQVAPILDRRGADRVYYRNGIAAAYSEMVGLNTNGLAEIWGMTDTLANYSVQQYNFPSESRWVESSAYWLTKDLVQAVPELGNSGYLMGLLEAYWQELKRLNSRQISRNDLLQKRELRNKDMDDDAYFRASIHLIQTGHEITAFLREKLSEIDNDPDFKEEWKGKPAKDWLLYLLHFHQTAVQRSIIWWLGVSHGHAHALNTVSKLPTDIQNAPSPLETRIIDFDRSQVRAYELAKNNEIYHLIDKEKVRQKIDDTSLNINVRLQMVMYLKPEHWDDSVFQLIDQNVDKPVIAEIVDLIRMKAQEFPKQHFTKAVNFIFLQEKKRLANDSYPAFYHSYYLAKDSARSLEGTASDVLQVYLQEGIVAASSKQLQEDEELLLLSGIFHNKSQGRFKTDAVDRSELEWTLQIIDKPGLVGDHAERLLSSVIRDQYETITAEVFQEAVAGNSQSVELVRKLLTAAFTRDKDLFTKYSQDSFINKLVEMGHLEFALRLLDFGNIPKEKAAVFYRKVKESLVDSYSLNEDPEKAKAIRKQFHTQVRRTAGPAFLMSQRIQELLRRNK